VVAAGGKQERDLLRTTSLRGIGLTVGLLLATAHDASAQYVLAQSNPAGDVARSPRPTKDVSPTSGPDVWDANHDGIYTCDEWKSYLDRLFTLADRNRDGRLDPSEFKTVRQTGATFADADFGYFDENQDGTITRSEFINKPNEFILQNDKNGDCRVTPAEMKGASTDQKSPPSGRRGH
jgi:Ca2+-binding EF-hand superfamily protein